MHRRNTPSVQDVRTGTIEVLGCTMWLRGKGAFHTTTQSFGVGEGEIAARMTCRTISKFTSLLSLLLDQISDERPVAWPIEIS